VFVAKMADQDPEEEFNRMSVEKLRVLLKSKGLSPSGKKKVLVKRLVAHEYGMGLQSTAFKPLDNNESSSLSATQNEEKQNAAQAKGEPNSEENEQLRRKLKILQGDVESLILAIKELSESSKNKIKMQMRLQRLNECRISCLELRQQFAFLTAEEDIELHNCNETLNAIDEAIDIVQEYIETAICKSAESVSSKETRQNLKLPKLELPTYSGDLLKFQNFWYQFEAAVHKNEDLPDIQKFTYLRSVLKGNALQTVEGFEVTGANYAPAVEALKHRYGRKRVIISSLIKTVINLEPTSSICARALRELHDTLKNRTRALEALGEQPMSHACILLPMFEAKLPSQLLEKWELELADISDEEIDLELFFKFLNRQLISKEAGERNQQTTPTSGIHSQGKGKAERKTAPNYRQERVTTAATLLSETTTPSCVFCKSKSNHESAECPEFKTKTVEERWKTVKSNKLCFNCLKPSHAKHFSKVCRHPKCSVVDCGKRHHRLLHEQREWTQASQAQPAPTFHGFAASDFKKPTETLLPTAVAKLSANNQTLEVRVLLDSGIPKILRS
jgi:hypothetical protein